jgi:hypothetical protein
MVTEENVRRVALSPPGSVERPYNRLPSFRVRENLFLRFHELPDAFFVRCAAQAHLRRGQGLHAVCDPDRPFRRGNELVELAKSNLRDLDIE